MTPEQIAGLEALLEHATSGPWTVGLDAGQFFVADSNGEIVATVYEWSQSVDEADAQLIALARHVLTQQAQIERMREALLVLMDRDAGEIDRNLAMKDARAALEGGDA